MKRRRDGGAGGQKPPVARLAPFGVSRDCLLWKFMPSSGCPVRRTTKGQVEGLVKYARSNFLAPIQVALGLDDLNAMPETANGKSLAS